MKGFTLIELLIVFSITTLFAGVGISSFTSYNRSQVFGTGVNEVSSMLNTARSRAVSQIKPVGCGTNPLVGYRVNITPSGSDYEEDAICSGTSPIVILKKKLPSSLIFDPTSSSTLIFDVSTGTVSIPGSFKITGFGKTTAIAVDKIGKIAVGSQVAAAPGLTPAPTGSGTTPVPTMITGSDCSQQDKAYIIYRGYCVFYGAGNGNYCNESCTIPAPTPTAGAGVTPIPACSKDYYYDSPSGRCQFVGGDRGGFCDSSCGGQVGGATPTATSTPIPTTVIATPTLTPTPTQVVPTPTPTPAIPTPTPIPSCSKDYYYDSPSGVCRQVGGNYGQYCDATCGGQVSTSTPTPTPTPSVVNYAPTITNATISSPTVTPDGYTMYTITITGTDPNGGNDIGVEYALVNYQGGNAGSYRGYVGWSTTGGFPYWASYKLGTPIPCSGSGQAAINSEGSGVWGPQHINLRSCSAPVVSGNTRVVSLVVSFNSSFTTPTTNNTISGLVHDWGGLEDSPAWKPFGLFNLAIVPTPTPAPTTAPTGTTGLTFTMSPNPASLSSSVTFTATIAGTGCTPSGGVYFYWDNQTAKFAGGSATGTNPSSVTSYPIPASYIGAGTHPVYAHYVPTGSCQGKDSSIINLVVQ